MQRYRALVQAMHLVNRKAGTCQGCRPRQDAGDRGDGPVEEIDASVGGVVHPSTLGGNAAVLYCTMVWAIPKYNDALHLYKGIVDTIVQWSTSGSPPNILCVSTRRLWPPGRIPLRLEARGYAMPIDSWQ